MKHHALVAYGSPEYAREFAVFIAKEAEMIIANNPNFHVRSYESLDVEEARILRDLAGFSAEGRRVFVIAASRVTREAQNALLKVFEEPGANMFFALLVPRGALIPTLLSRMQEVSFVVKKEVTSVAQDFLAATPAARSKLMAHIVEDKDKTAAYQLVAAIEQHLAKDIHQSQVRLALEEIATMRSYLMDTSASVKMILEHLVLVLPKK